MMVFNFLNASRDQNGTCGPHSNEIGRWASSRMRGIHNFVKRRSMLVRDLERRKGEFLIYRVIEYVQFLQEKVTKYEGSFAWMFTNSHWLVQSLNGHSQSVKNNGPGSAFPGKFDENYIPINPTMLASMHNPVESDPSKTLDHQQGITLPMPLPGTMSATNRSDGTLGHSLQRPVSDAQTNHCPITNNALNQRNELSVEGGTISMSTAYAQGLLNTLAQALQSAGFDIHRPTSQCKLILASFGQSEQSNLGRRCMEEVLGHRSSYWFSGGWASLQSTRKEKKRKLRISLSYYIIIGTTLDSSD
ncbi:hypothetical protein UlMin_045051 [Ulmus minor]